jgi:hypothetical protein
MTGCLARRVDIGDRIRDAKHGAALRHLPSNTRTANTVWMRGALLAANLSAWLQELGGLDTGRLLYRRCIASCIDECPTSGRERMV